MSSSQAETKTNGKEQLMILLQFPRRIVFLLIAYGLALILITTLRSILPGSMELTNLGQESDWTISWVSKTLVAKLIGERMPNTLLLLGTTLFVAFLMALMMTIIAVLVHALETKAGPLGSVLKGLGRLGIFDLATPPTFCLGLFLIYIFAVRLGLLPISGMASLVGPRNLVKHLPYFILPTMTLAIFPSILTAQTVARELTLPRSRTGAHLWLKGLFKGLGTLLGQIGGLLSGVVLVEVVFAWPGLGRMVVNAMIQHDFPVLFGILSVFAGLILVGRLGSELFRWLGRLISKSDFSAQINLTPWRRTARKIWVVIALLFLLIPLAFAVSGLRVAPDAVLKQDFRAANAPPSSDHPWGTDKLGRDLQARVLRGGLVTLGIATSVALFTLLPSGLGGALTGFLASCRKLWAESLADLLLLPADVLLFIPAVPAAIVLTMFLGQKGMAGVILACVIVLLPRAVRVFHMLWITAPEQRRGLTVGVAGLGGLFLGTLFAGLWLATALDFLGFGLQPPLPSLGTILGESRSMMFASPEGVISSGIVLWLCAFACYTAADALIGFFFSKDVMTRLNE